MTRTTLTHRDGSVDIEDLGNGRRLVSVRVSDPSIRAPVDRCETSYPVPLIEALLDVKSPAYLCDEILRDEDPEYVERNIRFEMLSYESPGAFAGRSMLDFGCGAGASAVVLARLLPALEIVGVDIDERLLAAARLRAEHHRLERVRFLRSPDPSRIPAEIGEVDYIMLSAVYEHLLPIERRTVLPALWERLRPGGVLFLNQTPYRFSPVEAHSTRLPLVNYLPAPLALRFARRFSPLVRRTDGWEDLLRKGIRGGTAGEILGIVWRSGGRAALLEPSRLGMRDRVDIWRAVSTSRRSPAALDALARAMKLWRRVTGVVITPSLSLAVRKTDGSSATAPAPAGANGTD